MSKRLHIRTLKLKKLPYDKFNYVVWLEKGNKKKHLQIPNFENVKPIKELLEGTAIGSWKIEDTSQYIQYNRGKDKIFTKIYLVEIMDVALIKLCYHESLRKIYKIIIE
jgi:hypothetical protein